LANLERVRALIGEERFQAAHDLLMGDPATAQPAEASRLLGLICVRTGKYTEAANYYEQVCTRSSDSEDWFNLAMARLMAGDAVHGIIALEEARHHQAGGKGKMSVPMMLFHFTGALLGLSMWDAAKRYLQELAETYTNLGKSNDSYLYAHNLPYFSWFLNAVVTAYRGSNSQRAGIAWLSALSPRLDPEGRAKVANAIRLLSTLNSSVRR